MSNVESAIAWMESKRGKVTYSMAHRNGPHSYDCSSAVYFALHDAGFKATRIGNTETMFVDLPALGWKEVPKNAFGGYDAKRGDIFIWGRRGASAGAFGHTGFFVDPDNIIHCNYGYNGITVNNHDVIWNANGRPVCTVYRYEGAQVLNTNVSNASTFKNPDANSPRWHVEAGDTLHKISMYYYGNTGRIKDIAKYNGLANENAINVGQTLYIPGPLVWEVTQEEISQGLTWERIDDYYGYGHGWTKSRNQGKSLTPGTVLNIWG